MRLAVLMSSFGLAALLCAPALAQQTATVEFKYDNPAMQPTKYVITVREDGSGRFHAEAGTVKPEDTAALPSEGQDRLVQLTAGTTQRIFATARAKKFFAMACEGGGDHVAFTGKKELSYVGSDGKGGCTFNYSKDQQIEWLASEMQGIAATLEEGRRLDIEHEHGRLTLDAELETLETMVHNGQAAELGNIAPTLLAIVKDEAVMERAQKRARHLLAIIDAAPTSSK